MKTVQKGFTLIELIVVIVILGILSATALPKFVDMGSDARRSVLSGIQGAATSAANMAYGKAAVANKDLTAASGQEVAITGVTGTGTGNAVKLVYGYPAATDIDALLQDKGGATFAAGVWTLKTNCTVTYAAPTGAGLAPVVTLSATSGC